MAELILRGTLIEGEGIAPDVVVEAVPDSTEDVQLAKAVEILRQKIILGG